MGDISISAWVERIERRKERERLKALKIIREPEFNNGVPAPDSRAYLRSNERKRKYYRAIHKNKKLTRWLN